MDKTDKALTLLDQLAAAGQLGPDKVAMRIKLNTYEKASFRGAKYRSKNVFLKLRNH